MYDFNMLTLKIQFFLGSTEISEAQACKTQFFLGSTKISEAQACKLFHNPEHPYGNLVLLVCLVKSVLLKGNSLY